MEYKGKPIIPVENYYKQITNISGIFDLLNIFFIDFSPGFLI